VPGAPQKKGGKLGFVVDDLGTFRELPRPLVKALKRTAVTSADGVAVRRLVSAFVGTITGDEPRTLRELQRIASAAGVKS
jgi:hypothetical protein